MLHTTIERFDYATSIILVRKNLDTSLNALTSFDDTMRSSRVDIERQIEALVNEVVAAYLIPGRGYHAIPHPAGMLVLFQKLCVLHGVVDSGEIDCWLMKLLICYHDVVILVGKKFGWNEEQSAEFAARHLRALGLSEKIIKVVVYGIRCTATHMIIDPPQEVDSRSKQTIALFLDFDLAGLGQILSSFQMDTENLWVEHSMHVSRAEYDQNCVTWATGLLKRPFIYHTPYFVPYEAQARANLEALVASAT